MPTSPNIKNYFQGSGNLYWTPEGGVERHVGNCPSYVHSPVTETREHKESMSGSRSVDRIYTIQTALNVTMSLEEITPENLGLFYGGAPALNTDGRKQFDILTATTARGQLRLLTTNEVGSIYEIILFNVELKPTGSFDWISDGSADAALQLEGTALKTGGRIGTVEEVSGETE